MFLRFLELWYRVRCRVFTALSRGGFQSLGRSTVIVPPLRIKGQGRIQIGEDVLIGSNSWLQVLTGSVKSNGVPVIVIGDRTSTAGFLTISAAESVIIESDVLIARYVYIADHSHAFDSKEVAIKDQGIARVSPVRVCRGAWLGQGVVVCPGVTIGRNAVIGANSVVLHDVPDYCVAAGAPARVVRRK